MTGHVSPVRTSDWVRPGHNIALCDTCGPPFVSAFTSRSRRDEWAWEHASRVGHDVERVDGRVVSGLLEPWIRTSLRVIAASCAATALILAGVVLVLTDTGPGTVNVFTTVMILAVTCGVILARDAWASRHRGDSGDTR